MNTPATPAASDTALLPPLNDSTLRVGYRIQIVSRDGTFLDWQGLFDLPGALTDSPQADEPTMLAFNQLLDVSLTRGISAMFCQKLHARADEILKAQVAKQPPARSTDRDSLDWDGSWHVDKERVARLMEAERLAGLPAFPSSPPYGSPGATGHPGLMKKWEKDDLNGPREDPFAALNQRAAEEAKEAQERMRAKNTTTAGGAPPDSLLHSAPPLTADAALGPAKRSRRRSEVQPKMFGPASNPPPSSIWEAPPLAKAA